MTTEIHTLRDDAAGYHPNYKRGAMHPAYWALAPEADHTLARAQ